MKRATLGIASALWASSSALAGTVTFEPPTVSALQGDIVELTVTLAATDMPEFDAIDVLISSDVAGLNLAFTFDASFNPSFPVGVPGALGLFNSDLSIGGFKAERWRAPLLLGVLRVDTSVLPPGTHSDIVGVRPQRELEATLTTLSKVTLGVASELLSGTAEIVILDPDAPPGGGSTDVGSAVDSDGDGVDDGADAFPDDPNETVDSDGDGIGDNADPNLNPNDNGADDTPTDTPTDSPTDAPTDGSDDGEGAAGGDGPTPVSVPICGGGVAAVLPPAFAVLFAARRRRRL